MASLLCYFKEGIGSVRLLKLVWAGKAEGPSPQEDHHQTPSQWQEVPLAQRCMSHKNLSSLQRHINRVKFPFMEDVEILKERYIWLVSLIDSGKHWRHLPINKHIYITVGGYLYNNKLLIYWSKNEVAGVDWKGQF